MKCLKQYREIIKATDETIEEIVRGEIDKLGNNSDLNHIDVSGVTIMRIIFYNSQFNGNISLWDVRNVRDMTNLFYNSKFNGDISRWNVGNIMNMHCMFSFSQFNGDISRWNVSNVTNMIGMFWHSQFNGDLSNWDVHNVEDMIHAFLCSPLEGREPWWYRLSPFFKDDNYSMYDSLDFGWIDIEGKVIYRERLSRTLKRAYNKEWNGELPKVHNFTYN